MAHDLSTVDAGFQAATNFFSGVPSSSIGQMTGISPAEDWREMVGRKWAATIFPSTISPTKATMAEPIDAGWFRQALEILAKAEIDAAGDPERLEILELAEHLIAHFAAWPEHIRPRFSVDALDRPAFSSKSPRHYLHATLDPDLGFHWYAELDGEEIEMADDHPPEALQSQLPASLAALLHAY